MYLLKKVLSSAVPEYSADMGHVVANGALDGNDGGKWDALVALARDKGINVLPGGSSFDNAISVGGVDDAVKKITVGGKELNAKLGDVIIGDRFAKDFVLAHELGHSEVNKNAGNLYKKLIRLSRGADQAITDNLPKLLELSANNNRRLAVLGLSTAAKLPKLYDEAAASAAGRDMMRAVGASEENANKAFAGMKGYIAQDIGANTLLAGITRFLK